MLLTGFLLIVCTGLCWIGFGVLVSLCAGRGWSFDLVQGLSYIGGALICGALLAADGGMFPPGADPKGLSFIFLVSFCGGIASFYTFFLTAKAMRIGPNGLIWGIMQAGMIGSTLMGVFCFGEKLTPLSLTGLILIVGGVLAMGFARDRRNGGAGGKKWLLPTLSAFVLVMATQCFCTLPSFLQETVNTGSLFRAFAVYAGGAFAFAVTTLPGVIRSGKFGGRGEWISAAVLTASNVGSSCFLLYRGLDLLAKAGAGGLGYPICTGICVAGFSLYSLLLLKEKIAPAGLAGLSAVCVGIVAIALP